MLAFFFRLTPRVVFRTSFGVMLLGCSVAACSDNEGENGDGDGDGDASGDGGTSGDGDGDAPGGAPGDGGAPVYTPRGEPCEFGDDADKCEGEAALACAPVFGPTGTACDRDEDCGADELCFASSDPDASAGVCLRLYGECLSLCGGDFDCATGEVCDIGSGLCAPDAELGEARFGESCTTDDDCAGTCVPVGDGVFECEEHCRVGATSGCGFETLSDSNVACAYFAYDLSDLDVVQGAGDVGICATLCDCTADCPGDQKCLPRALRGYAGVCTGGAVEDEVTACPDSGGGGAGGAGNP